MANKIYNATETPIVFTESGGSYVITLLNLGFGAGRISARADKGAGSKPSLYRWRAVIQWEDHPVATEYAEIYLAQSDGTKVDGGVGTADAALTLTQNLQLLGIVSAEAAAGSTDRIASGLVEIHDRYFSIGVFNRSAADNLKNSANVSNVTLTPVPAEIQ